jgi:hypothetical protein
MQRNYSSLKIWFTVLGIIVLIAGFAMAYQVKEDAIEGDASHYQLVGGQAYSFDSADSKADADTLQKYGGDGGRIIAVYKRKLHNLFQGENLAYLLVIVTVIVAAWCFRVAWESE